MSASSPVKLRTLIAKCQSRAMPLHISPKANAVSVIQNGIMSPAEARRRGVPSTLGSDGSNVSVVQLFDYSNLDLRQSDEQLRDLLDSNSHLTREWAVFTIDARVREDESFVKLWHVQRQKDFRYYPETEVWIKSDKLSPQLIVEVWIVQKRGEVWTALMSDSGVRVSGSAEAEQER